MKDESTTNTHKKERVTILGGGWTGLCAALEASNYPEFEVHLYEATNRLGGKVSGSVSQEGKASTHAIRLLSEYYFDFFEALDQIPLIEDASRTLLDRLSPLDTFYFISDEKNRKTHSISRKQSEKKKASLQLLHAAVRTFGVQTSDLLKMSIHFYKFRKLEQSEKEHYKNESLENHLESWKISKKAKDFMLNFMGITAALKPSSSAYVGMDLLSKMFIGGVRAKCMEVPKFTEARNWIIDGPLEERLIPSFQAELLRRNVHIHLNSPVKEIIPNPNNPDKAHVLLENGLQIQEGYLIAGLNNKILENIGLGRKDSKGSLLPLKNEWSSGFICPLEKLPKALSQYHLKSAFATIDSPWAIVGMIMTHQNKGGLWSNDVVFPKNTHYFLETVVSKFHTKGSNGKSFFECNPEEAKIEILKQIGFKDQDHIQKLLPLINLGDNLSYEDKDFTRSDSAMGPVNTYGKKWVLRAPLYASNPKTPPFCLETEFSNVFRAGEACTFKDQRIHTPTLELCSSTAKAAVQKIVEKTIQTQK